MVVSEAPVSPRFWGVIVGVLLTVAAFAVFLVWALTGRWSPWFLLALPLVGLPIGIAYLLVRRLRLRVTADERGLAIRALRPRGEPRPVSGVPWSDVVSLRTGGRGRWAYLAMKRRSVPTLGRIRITAESRAGFEELARAGGVPVTRDDAAPR